MKMSEVGNEIIFDKNLVDISKSQISIVGNHNKIIFNGEMGLQGSLSINVVADNNIIVFGQGIQVNRHLHIAILPAGSGSPSYDNHVYIGNKSFFNGNCSLILAESNTTINIGENCLFASGITCNTSDSHPMFLLEDGQRINKASSINIGNHVWIGNNVHMLKGSGIGNDSVIGSHAIVTKFFDESNVAIAGNPAKIIRQGIDWRQDARIERI